MVKACLVMMWTLVSGALGALPEPNLSTGFHAGDCADRQMQQFGSQLQWISNGGGAAMASNVVLLAYSQPTLTSHHSCTTTTNKDGLVEEGAESSSQRYWQGSVPRWSGAVQSRELELVLCASGIAVGSVWRCTSGETASSVLGKRGDRQQVPTAGVSVLRGEGMG